MKLRRIEGGQVAFRCPGCGEPHVIPVAGPKAWGFNGSDAAPTFTPSILVRSGHHAPSARASDCWCTYRTEHPEDEHVPRCGVCHSFVTDGRIQFLGDCTHALAGRTVDLPDWQEAP